MDYPRKSCLSRHHGMTSLMIAARDGDLQTVQYLLNQNVNVDLQDDRGYTALLYACRDGYNQIVRLLLDAGANPTLSTKFGYCPLICASQNGFSAIVSMLLQFVDVNIQDIDGMSPLILACKNNHVDTVRVLLEHGADYSLYDNTGHTAVMYAVDFSNFPMLSLFQQFHIPLYYTIQSMNISAIYVAGVRKQRMLAKFLLLNEDNIYDWFESITMFPNSITEYFIEDVIYSMKTYLLDEETIQFDSLLIEYLSQSLLTLLNEYSGCATTGSLSGLVEVCIWCLRVYKHLYSENLPQSILYLFTKIEKIINHCSYVYLSFHSPSLSSKQVKLLFSFMEIYCLGMDDACVRCCSTKLNVRLNSFMNLNKNFIQ